MGILDYRRDGYVTISSLDRVLSKMDAEITQELEKFLVPLTEEVVALRADVKRLRAEIETERRLRLGARK